MKQQSVVKENVVHANISNVYGQTQCILSLLITILLVFMKLFGILPIWSWCVLLSVRKTFTES